MSDRLFNQVQCRYDSVMDRLETELQKVSASIDVLDLYVCSQPEDEELVRLFAQIVEDFDQSVKGGLPGHFGTGTLLDGGSRPGLKSLKQRS